MIKNSWIILCLLLVQIGNSQSWNLTLNNITGNPNFGTSSNHPINFFTNGTQKMSLGQGGLLKINSLAGTGSRFIQTDATGNLIAWTGSGLNAGKILFGDGAWKDYPFNYDAGKVTLSNGATKLGINVVSPVVELDVNGAINATGVIKAPSGFLFSSTDGFTFDQASGNFLIGKVGSGSPAINNCSSLPNIAGSIFNGQGGFITGQDYMMVGSTAATNVKAALRMFVLPSNGSGYIDLDGRSNTSFDDNVLYLNYYCGRNTAINTGSNGGIVYIGTGSATAKLIAGEFVSMKKHVEIGDPTTGIINATSNSALDININSGKGLKFKTTTSTIPLIFAENTGNNVYAVFGDGQTEINTTNPDAIVVKDGNLFNNIALKIHSSGTAEFSTAGSDAILVSQTSGGSINFKVRSTGLTEITSSIADALIIKNGSGGSINFNIKSDGKTFIGSNVGIGVQPSSTSFLNISAGANTSNADLIVVGSNNYPNALKIDYKGVALFNVTGTSGSLFKIKNQGIDLFAVRYDGVAFAREVVVTLSSFPDYVFANDYKLISLKEVKKYINLNNKLPHMPSAKEVNENGASLGEIQKITVEKVEELFLYVIQLEEKIEILNNKLKDFENAK
jgi:hypothetical protein